MNSLAVIIPTYNRHDTICTAIDSVFAQTYSPDEIIVIDDGSTDGSSELLRSKYGDSIHLISQKNKGVSAARNAGVLASSSEYIAFLDSDDIWEPNKLEEQTRLMVSEDIVLTATNWKYENSSERAFDELDIDGDTLLLDDPLNLLTKFSGHKLWLPTWIVKKDAFNKVGGFDERMSVAEDTRLLFRLSFEGKFNITTSLGTIRSADIDSEQLTIASDENYRKLLACLTIEILFETYAKSYKKNKKIQKNLRKLLSYFLQKNAVFLYKDGYKNQSRLCAYDSLFMSTGIKSTFTSVLLMLAPRLYLWFKI